MRRFLISAALIVITSLTARATESLIFDGGGYNIQILVGQLDDPVVAQVRFTAPEAKEAVVIPQETIRVENFDMKKEILIMHFLNKDNPDLPASFSLSVKNSNAVLSIGGKKIKSEFNWEI